MGKSEMTSHPLVSRWKGLMIQTEQLAPGTIMFHVRGRFDQGTAKELGLLVFRSYRLGCMTFLFNLSQVTFLDQTGNHHLTMIRRGLREKGKSYRVIGPPSSIGDQLIIRTTLQHLPPETWN